MRETVIMRDILVAVTALPDGMFWRANVGTAVSFSGQVIRFNVKGMADIMGAYRGRPVAIETKTVTGKQLTSQNNFQAAWERAGGRYILARSVDEAMKALRNVR